MAIGDLAIFSALKAKMQWHQTRQRLLAENVANADTPEYRPKDLKPGSFADRLRTSHGGAGDSVPVARTHSAHIAAAVSGLSDSPRATEQDGWETTPSGNGVVLEQEMMKITANQMDYQAAATLYSRSIALLKIAVGSQ